MALATSELQLLALCARTHPSAEACAEAERLIARGIDWEPFVQQARAHRVAPLADQVLRKLDAPVPEEVLENLRAYVRSWATNGLLQMRLLLDLLALLERHSIPALPFKGPVLGTLVYGDTARRPFGDLDIWVPQEDIYRTEALLREEGFRLYSDASSAEAKDQTFFADEKSYELVRDDTVVELHWDFLHPMHGFHLDPQEVWSRRHSARVGGRMVPVLSPEDRVLYLCTHGSKHYWERLSYVCDVAESVRVHSDALDWSLLLERARALHAERMLHLGLHLAATLLGATFPAHVTRSVEEQQTATRQLIAQVEERLRDSRTDHTLTLADARFHLAMRERLRDRLPYYRHLCWLAVQPNQKDKSLMDVPERLSFLYYLLRPVRLVRSVLPGTPAGERRSGER